MMPRKYQGLLLKSTVLLTILTGVAPAIYTPNAEPLERNQTGVSEQQRLFELEFGTDIPSDYVEESELEDLEMDILDYIEAEELERIEESELLVEQTNLADSLSSEQNRLNRQLNEEVFELLNTNIVSALENVENLAANQEETYLERIQLSSSISELKLEIEDKENEIEEVNDRIKALEKSLSKRVAKLEDTEQQLENAEQKLEQTEREIAKRKEFSRSRLRAIQKNGSSTNKYLDIILSGKPVDEIVGSIFAVNRLQRASNNLIGELKDLTVVQEDLLENIEDYKEQITSEHEELDKKRSGLTSDKEQLVSESKELDTRKDSLEDYLDENREVLSSIYLEVSEYQLYIETMESNIDRVLSNLESIEHIEREEEQERLRQVAELERLRTQVSSYNSSTQPVLAQEIPVSSDVSDIQQKIIQEANKYLGVPYVWGGSTPRGFDCSGLTQYVYRAAGIELPRVSRDQARVGRPVDLADIQVGDLIFWGSPVFHVAIYAGNGNYIHAPSTGDVVRYANRPLNAASHIRRVIE